MPDFDDFNFYLKNSCPPDAKDLPVIYDGKKYRIGSGTAINDRLVGCKYDPDIPEAELSEYHRTFGDGIHVMGNYEPNVNVRLRDGTTIESEAGAFFIYKERA